MSWYTRFSTQSINPNSSENYGTTHLKNIRTLKNVIYYSTYARCDESFLSFPGQLGFLFFQTFKKIFKSTRFTLKLINVKQIQFRFYLFITLVLYLLYNITLSIIGVERDIAIFLFYAILTTLFKISYPWHSVSRATKK